MDNSEVAAPKNTRKQSQCRFVKPFGGHDCKISDQNDYCDDGAEPLTRKKPGVPSFSVGISFIL